MFGYGVSVSTNQRSTKRIRGAEARVVFESLLDDGKAFFVLLFLSTSGQRQLSVSSRVTSNVSGKAGEVIVAQV